MTRSGKTARNIFEEAVELVDARQRQEFLDQACGDDRALQAEVLGLLKAHEEATGLFESELSEHGNFEVRVPSEWDATIERPGIEQPGMMIAGKYKLLESIGEGGMGAVWVAEQTHPLKRRVAIKMIKAGMDSKQVLARFEAERQALALMDHPNIAKVFDGGMTDQGRPYFVMEFVKGVPFTEYCDQARLSLQERLALFTPVCQAVQHAHQKGIIHRDLKPSNILICLYDGKPVPKVIDFGLAKAMYQSLTEQSLHTAFGMMVGTRLYMSPEQAEHNNLDVDTRTEIYSLGVILYELLTGSTPLERHQMKEAALNEILRLIKEVDPPRPSTRLSGSARLPSVAAQRSVDPKQLQRSLTGDLDWIVLKALDKERSRRYETANGLARDIERYLNDEAVGACPPNAVYRMQKFVKRNKGKVLAASLVLLALVAGITSTSWQWYRAEQSLVAEAIQRKKAEDNQRDAEAARADAVTQQVRAKEHEAEAIKQASIAKAQEVEAMKQEAEARRQAAEAKQQATIAQAVIDFQSTMFATADPYQLLGQKKYVEAETNLLAGYEGMQEREASIPPPGRNRLHDALTRLVQLDTDWHAAEPDQGHAEKAAQWQQKLDDHSATLTQDDSTRDLDK